MHLSSVAGRESLDKFYSRGPCFCNPLIPVFEPTVEPLLFECIDVALIQPVCVCFFTLKHEKCILWTLLFASIHVARVPLCSVSCI